MDFENKNDVLDTENAVEETEKAMDSFLKGSSDTEDGAKKDNDVVDFVTNKEAVVCGISLFALAAWNFSSYGALIITALALLGMVFIKAGKNATQICVSNALTIGVASVLVVTLAVIKTLVQTYYFYALDKSISTSFANTLALFTNLISIAVFVIFIINALCLSSKSHTPIFAGTAKKFTERED